MSKQDLLTPFPWTQFSQKAKQKIEKLRSMGHFTKEEAALRHMRLSVGKEGSAEEGNVVKFFLLVDETDGTIVDAKASLFGHAALIAVTEAACELLVGKNHDQAKRLSADLIEKKLADSPNAPPFPPQIDPLLNLVMSAIDQAIEMCQDIPLPATYASPVPNKMTGEEGYPNWSTLSHEQKVTLIEKTLDEEIRPYVELDAGGVSLKEFTKKNEVIIVYQGACTSCFSAIGTTLSTIQHILQTKLDASLSVVPNMDDLNF